MHLKIKHLIYGGHFTIGHIDYLLYKSSTNHIIFTEGLSVNEVTPIVGGFLHDKTCASKIFAKKCEILTIFLIISGSHLGLSLKYHIPAFVNTMDEQTNVRLDTQTVLVRRNLRKPCSIMNFGKKTWILRRPF